MILSHNLRSGRQTERVKAALLRYIHDAQLSCGDRLPSQQTLRKELRVGGSPIAAAISILGQDGVLKIVDKVGVFVSDLNLSGLDARQVIVLSNPAAASSLNASLFYYTNLLLLKSGAQCVFVEHDRCYKQTLKRLLEGRHIDAVLNLSDFDESVARGFARQKIPMFFCNTQVTPLAAGGIRTYTQWCFQDSLTRLAATGARRIWGISGNRAQEELFFQRACEAVPAPAGVIRQFVSMPEMRGLPETKVEAYIHSLALRMLADRPEAISFLDDVAATRLFAELRCMAPHEYQPAIAVLCNRQIPCMLPYPHVLYYEVDLVQLAAHTVQMLEDFWQNKWESGRIELFKPQLRANQPF